MSLPSDYRELEVCLVLRLLLNYLSLCKVLSRQLNYSSKEFIFFHHRRQRLADWSFSRKSSFGENGLSSFLVGFSLLRRSKLRWNEEKLIMFSFQISEAIALVADPEPPPQRVNEATHFVDNASSTRRRCYYNVWWWYSSHVLRTMSTKRSDWLPWWRWCRPAPRGPGHLTVSSLSRPRAGRLRAGRASTAAAPACATVRTPPTWALRVPRWVCLPGPVSSPPCQFPSSSNLPSPTPPPPHFPPPSLALLPAPSRWRRRWNQWARSSVGRWGCLCRGRRRGRRRRRRWRTARPTSPPTGGSHTRADNCSLDIIILTSQSLTPWQIVWLEPDKREDFLTRRRRAASIQGGCASTQIRAQ